ncbi:MAG: phage integrase N-terminal SAM-like domain-containing protein [Desulfobacterales bacterium]|nr:phage integrase N-terminal SAM-like domain-containing protein [Desulfobacterales bacterium]MDD4072753.1 phage integrase N-terminal SAM-like domain-containing protein [Desulfobacterales bacterium]MDD4392469.1 phage integrase N-terminal SAM-like domain-containing protein [Desulfobacterales bacterium]
MIQQPDTENRPKLLNQVRYAIRAKHYSIRTEDAYVQWIRRYILFHNKRHPRDMGSTEINQFLTHLAVKGNVAASTQNQALSALLFLYKEILHQDTGSMKSMIRAKKPDRLPVVFSREEVRDVMYQLVGMKWIMANLLYGSGLRLMECIRLRVKDVDFSYNQIIVRCGMPHRCKSRECCSSKATRGEAVVCYREPLATQEMQYSRLSWKVNKMIILIKGNFSISCFHLYVIID